jgi:hypothetical protein
MTAGTPDDPRFPAAIDVLRRTGAKEFQIRYSDDEQPVVWFAVAGYTVRHGRPVSTGKINTHEAAAALDPVRAVFRLCDQLVDGGECTHCHRPAGFNENPDALPLDQHICWWTWDPEVLKFVQGCQLGGDAS